MPEQTCLTCGTRVEVVSTDEGTHHYRPAEDERYGPTVATEREQMQALIDQQAKALEWQGSVTKALLEAQARYVKTIDQQAKALEAADALAAACAAMDGSGFALAHPHIHEAAKHYRSARTTERTTDG